MAYHSLELCYRLIGLSHWVAEHQAANTAAWWLHRHPEPKPGTRPFRQG